MENLGPYPSAVERFPTVRQSRLAAFDRCALATFFDEEYRQTWTGHPQARGQIMHRAIAECLRWMNRMSEGTIETDAALEIYEDSLRQDDVDRVCIDCGKPIVRQEGHRVICANDHAHSSSFVNLPEEQIKDGRWIIVKFAYDNAFDIENLVDIEKKLETTIRYPDGAGSFVTRRLTGTLDAWFVQGEEDEEAVVLDWKDTWDLPGPTEVGFDGYFQQRFYAFLIFKNYPQIQKVTLREHYLRYSESREAIVWRTDIEDVERELSALVERFDRAFHEHKFPPAPGRHCLSMCVRPAACPIFPGVRGEGQIMDAETAERVAKEAMVAEGALKQRKKALSAWAAVNGPVPISDHKGKRAWGHKEITRTVRPDRETLEKAIAADAPLNLDELFVTKKGTRFQPHAPEPVDPKAETEDDVLARQLEDSIRKP